MSIKQDENGNFYIDLKEFNPYFGFNYIIPEKELIPHVCPVCGGNGLVPNGFYNQTSGEWSSTSTIPETCRACNGKGYVLV